MEAVRHTRTPGRRLTTEQVVAALGRRVGDRIELPPAGFDALAEADRLVAMSRRTAEELLARYRLPFLPPDNAHPGLIELWRAMLSPGTSGPFEVVLPGAATPAVNGTAVAEFGRADVVAVRGRPLENSRNWSGVYVESTPASPFVQVIGAWTVPDIEPPPPAIRGQKLESGRFRSSIWVGLDGHRSRPDESLPQIGTGQFLTVDGGRIEKRFVAWYQWWVNGFDFPPVPLADFPVKPGDAMIASVTRVPRDVFGRYPIMKGSVLMHLKNQSTGKLAIVYFPAPVVQDLTGRRVRGRAKGRTAEWIVERATRHPSDGRPLTSLRPNKGKPLTSARKLPNEPGDDGLYRLPDYGEVCFDRCLALSMSDDGGPVRVHDLRAASRIRMYETRQNPHRTAYVSTPEITGNVSARVRYRIR